MAIKKRAYTNLYATWRRNLKKMQGHLEAESLGIQRAIRDFDWQGVTEKDPLASLAGVEPATCRLGGGCSILLSYRDLWGA